MVDRDLASAQKRLHAFTVQGDPGAMFTLSADPEDAAAICAGIIDHLPGLSVLR